MSEAAVAEAPAADSQTANPTPDSQATASQDVASPNAQAGTDGEQSASSTAQTATTPDASAPASPEAPEAVVATPERTLSPEDAIAEATRRLEAQAQEKQRAEAQQKAEAELRDLRNDASRSAREGLEALEEHLDVRIPKELKAVILNAVDNVSAKALQAAKLELGDLAAAEKGQTDDLWMGNIRSGVDPAQMSAFDKDIKEAGYTYKAILDARQKYAPKAPGVLSVADLTTEAAAYAAEAANALSAEEQTALTEALKGAKTAKAVIEAVGKAMRGKGRSDPGQAVAGDGRASNGPASLAEAEQMHAGLHPSGQRITHAQMRRYKATGQI